MSKVLLIKKYIFPYKLISEQGQYMTQQDKLLVEIFNFLKSSFSIFELVF